MKLILYVAIIGALFISLISANLKKIDDTNLNRIKRGVFPSFSSFGFIAAVAIPLDLKFHSYFSFTFEANYALPDNNTHKDFLQKWNPDEYLPNNISSRANDIKRSIETHPLSSRLSFYKAVTQYFQHFGYNGRACLLRTICEVAHHELVVHNGVWGSILHVLFLPATSMDEGLSDDFYFAQYYGETSHCKRYHRECEVSFIEFITTEFEV